MESKAELGGSGNSVKRRDYSGSNDEGRGGITVIKKEEESGR